MVAGRSDRGSIEAVEFLTEIAFDFRFTQRDNEPNRQTYFDFDPVGTKFKADEVIMFSGGLDSVPPARSRLLATTSSGVVLVTHRSAQKAIPRQVELGRYLAQRFEGRVLHIHVVARRAGKEATDWNQRSRSLLFVALGQAVAQAFGARRLSFFENGIVSHNLPLSKQIVGTMASRTTHPLALRNLDRLVQLVSPTAPPIENRYQWLTKCEVVERIDQHGAAEQIHRAVSCTSVREQEDFALIAVPAPNVWIAALPSSLRDWPSTTTTKST